MHQGSVFLIVIKNDRWVAQGCWLQEITNSDTFSQAETTDLKH